jgi:uncharacterized protein (DUF58 family)
MALLTKIKTRLAIHSRRPVSGLLEGRYTSMQAGRSLDFVDLREYIPGDDVSDIDWKASARHGGLLVKRYVADRKHTVFLVVDTGRELSGLSTWTGVDGAQGTIKRDLAVTVAGLIGWIAVSHGDYVGLAYHGADGPVMARPTTRELELERMLTLVDGACRPDSPAQRTVAVLEHTISGLRRRTIMFVVLGDVEVEGAVEDALRRLLVQHDVVLITLGDVDPTEPGRAGLGVRDPGTGRRLPHFATQSAALATELAAADAARDDRRRATLGRLGIAHLHLTDPDRVIPDLLALLDRMRRGR